MTFSTTLDNTRHRVAYYVKFDGIAEQLSTHPLPNLAGTFYADMDGPPSGGGQRLDRRRGIVMPAGFSFRCHDTDDVRAFVARNGGTETTLQGPIDLDDTALTLSSITETYAEGTNIYVERETITLTTYGTFGEYTTIVRGVEGSIVQEHVAGAIISDRPRFWIRRRATLYQVFLDTDETKALRTGMMGSTPRFNNGLWEFDLIDMMTELNRPIYHGWAPQGVTSRTMPATDAATGASYIDLIVGDIRQIVDSVPGSARVHLRLRRGDDVNIYKLMTTAIDVATKRVRLFFAHQIYRNSGGIGFDGGSGDIEVQNVQLVQGTPEMIFLSLLLSDLGQFANDATYDQLLGRTLKNSLDTDLARARMGAGIPSAWVDPGSFWPDDTLYYARAMSFYLDEEMSVIDVWANEFSWRLGGYLYVSPAGKITFKKYTPSVPDASLDSFTQDDFISANPTSVEDETDIIGYATWETNWNVARRRYDLKTAVVFSDLVQTYGDKTENIGFKSRSLWVGSAGDAPFDHQPWSHAEIVAALDRWYARTVLGVHRIALRAPWALLEKLTIGTRFLYADTRLPDHEGARGFPAQTFEVVGTNENYAEGVIDIEAEKTNTASLVAPSGYITGLSTLTFSFNEASPFADLWDAANPESDFSREWQLRIYDASTTPPFAANDVVGIASMGGGGALVTIDADTSFGIANGDLVVLENSADVVTLNQNDANVQDHIFMVDSGGLIDNGGATERAGTRWG